VNDDPFAALGLPARAGLTDEDVRAAWRRIAAATHPDRDDGGDAARFGAAAAAYDTLRTSFGRGEALADLGLAGRAPRDGGRRGAHAASSPPGARHARRTTRAALPRPWPWTRRWPGTSPGPGTRRWPATIRWPASIRWPATRPGPGASWQWRRLLLRAGAAVAGLAVALAAAGWTPATVGLLAGALTWVAAAGWPLLRGRGEG